MENKVGGNEKRERLSSLRGKPHMKSGFLLRVTQNFFFSIYPLISKFGKQFQGERLCPKSWSMAFGDVHSCVHFLRLRGPRPLSHWSSCCFYGSWWVPLKYSSLVIPSSWKSLPPVIYIVSLSGLVTAQMSPRQRHHHWLYFLKGILSSLSLSLPHFTFLYGKFQHLKTQFKPVCNFLLLSLCKLPSRQEFYTK